MTMSGVYHFRFDPAMTLGACASGAAENMLRCARGNSGVILSVFFRGVARALKEQESATIADFAQAMDAGVKGAYQAVMQPHRRHHPVRYAGGVRMCCAVGGDRPRGGF